MCKDCVKYSNDNIHLCLIVVFRVPGLEACSSRRFEKRPSSTRGPGKADDIYLFALLLSFRGNSFPPSLTIQICLGASIVFFLNLQPLLNTNFLTLPFYLCFFFWFDIISAKLPKLRFFLFVFKKQSSLIYLFVAVQCVCAGGGCSGGGGGADGVVLGNLVR